MMGKRYPILITAKGESIRFPEKNKKLLPYTARWLGNNKDRCILLTDSLDLINSSNNFGISGYYINNNIGEIPTILDWIEGNNYVGNYIIMLPLTQPLRNINLLDMLENFDNPQNYDFITSFTYLPDRSIFEISEDGKFIVESPERLGKLCKKRRVLDGSIYLIKTAWIKEVSKYGNNWNSKFWSGKIGLIENTLPLLDIDYKEDLNILTNIIDTIRIIT